jgi:hypothetical protein
LGLEQGLQPCVTASRAAAYLSAEGQSKAADFIAFAVALIFVSRFPPENRVSSPKTT